MKRIFVSITLVLCGLCGHAQAVLSLDSCRAMALRNNKELAQSKADLKAIYDAYPEYQKNAEFLAKLTQFKSRFL